MISQELAKEGSIKRFRESRRVSRNTSACYTNNILRNNHVGFQSHLFKRFRAQNSLEYGKM